MPKLLVMNAPKRFAWQPCLFSHEAYSRWIILAARIYRGWEKVLSRCSSRRHATCKAKLDSWSDNQHSAARRSIGAWQPIFERFRNGMPLVYMWGAPL